MQERVYLPADYIFGTYAMTDPRHIHISDYAYTLPEERIAKYPLPERDSSKLLIYNHGNIEEDTFHNLSEHIPSGSLMVFNNTRVVRARLHFHKDTGALIEVFILEPASPVEYQENFLSTGQCEWFCLVGNLKKWKEGCLSLRLPSGDILQAERLRHEGTSERIRFSWTSRLSWAEILEQVGELPIPPYLNRKTETSDLTTYQTIYSRIKGSVAAPTAGLHFTERVFEALRTRGIEREEVTLHVGAGTFRPVKSTDIGGHDMHTEHIAVERHTIERLIAHQGHAIAVGTTSVRTLESLYYMGLAAERLMLDGRDTGQAEELHVTQWQPYDTPATRSSTDAMKSLLDYMERHRLSVLHSSTQIIIAPGYEYHVVQSMVTNFHQPQSTLLLLVSAFVRGNWHSIYDYALTHDFRFLSYGDACLLMP